MSLLPAQGDIDEQKEADREFDQKGSKNRGMSWRRFSEFFAYCIFPRTSSCGEMPPPRPKK